MIRFVFIFVLVGIFSLNLLSQNDTIISPDSTLSGYEETTIIGGPGDLSDQISEDNKVNDEALLTMKKPFLYKWFDLKEKINEKTGFQFTLSYALGYMQATESKGSSWALGGIFQFDLQWGFLAGKVKNKGILGLRVENRHSIFSEITLSQMGKEIGSLWRTDISFSRVYFDITQIWWEQHFWKDKLALRIGKTVNPAYLYDLFYFRNPFWGLESEPTVFSAAPWPANPLGVIGYISPIKKMYILAGIHDANGSFNDFGLNTVFDGQNFYVLETGYAPDPKDYKTNNYHVTFWYKNQMISDQMQSGWGLIFSFQRKIWDKFVPFIRYSYSLGGLTQMESLLTAGFGINFIRQEFLAFAIYFGIPSDKEVRNQSGIEVLYKINLYNNNIYLVPTTQLLINPSYSHEQSVIGVFSLRARVAL